jgi:hypothetical protein
MRTGMSRPVHVDAYSGYRANERPVRFALEGRTYDVAEIESRWYSPDADFFRIRTSDGDLYLLRYERTDDAWTLESPTVIRDRGASLHE